jgi:hypothetical protein
MRVMVLVKATEASERGTLPTPELLDEMGRFNEELRAAGVLREVGGLRPSADGVRIRFDGAERRESAGPFGAPGEIVAGFWIWEVADMDEAIAYVKRCPNPMPVPSDIEIRPFHDLADLPMPDA